jgi:hypothetical protein
MVIASIVAATMATASFFRAASLAPQVPLLVTPGVFDFGAIPNDGERTAEFTIRNQSRSPVAIIALQTDCGCTVASIAQKNVLPGRSTTLRVAFNPQSLVGHVRRSVRITANAVGERAQHHVEVELRAAPYAASPRLRRGTS